MLTYSAKSDSPETVREIIALNAVREKVCPKDKNPDTSLDAPHEDDDEYGIVCGAPCVIHGSNGGYVYAYVAQAQLLKAAKVPVIVDGPCMSACTMLVDIDRDRVCITTRAVFGYHQGADTVFGKQENTPMHFDTPGLEAWIDAHGGQPVQPDIMIVHFDQMKQFYKPCDGAS